MSTILRFFGLVVVLNVIRYLVGGLFEQPLIFPGLMGAMEENPSYFATEFTTVDWVTSFAYNFVMWLVVVWIYHISRTNIRGSEVVKSLKVFGIMFLFFASVSFIYMNHYSHPKAFYFWNVLDGAMAFTLVGLANGLLYPKLMPTPKATNAADRKDEQD